MVGKGLLVLSRDTEIEELGVRRRHSSLLIVSLPVFTHVRATEQVQSGVVCQRKTAKCAHKPDKDEALKTVHALDKCRRFNKKRWLLVETLALV